jgi:all-trans-nonaprenyl-diphosphate synthase
VAVASPQQSPASILDAVVAPVKEDMEMMNTNIKNIVGNRHPMLMAAAEQIFGAGGKKLRPVLVFLVARATAKHMGLT